MKRIRMLIARMIFFLGLIIGMTLLWTGFFTQSLQIDSGMSFIDFTFLSNASDLGKVLAVRILLVALLCAGLGYVSRKLFISIDSHAEAKIRFPAKMILLIAEGFILSSLVVRDNFSAISYFLNDCFLIVILTLYVFLALDQNFWDWLFVKPKSCNQN